MIILKYSLGIDIGGTKCAVLLGTSNINENKDKLIIRKSVFETNRLKGPDYAIDMIIDAIDKIIAEEEISMEEVVGIGISCGGPLDTESGIILNPPNLYGWNSVRICDILHKKYKVKVKLENDANACAVAEWKFGAAIGYRNVIFLTFGTGLGAGMILNGKLYSGTNNMAGEVGHIRLSEAGPVGYGKIGSLEGFCSGGGIAQIARSKVLEKLQMGEKQNLCQEISDLDILDAKRVAEAADAGDVLAKEIYAQSGEYLGKGLSIIIDILNPEIIVIGSIYQRSSHLLWPSAKKVIERESLERSRMVCKIVPAKLGDNIGDYAALSLALLNEEGVL